MPTAGEPAGRAVLSGIRNKISSSLFTHHKSSSFIGLFCLHPIFYFSIFEVMKPLFKILPSFFFVLSSFFSFSQTNLVPNFSFEQYSTCPTGQDQIQYATGWSKYSISTSTPDYYNACAPSSGFGVPKSLACYQ